MGEFIGPGAHHGATPIKDPLIAGITAGGDSAEPAGSRPHREWAIGAMVLVLLVAGLCYWLLFKPAGSDADARAAAAELGFSVGEDWRVETIEGGFRLITDPQGSEEPLFDGYTFEMVETDAVAAPVDPSTWDPQIEGVTAYAEGEPPMQLLIDAGEHSWIVTPVTPGMYSSNENARSAWYYFATSIDFTPGS